MQTNVRWNIVVNDSELIMIVNDKDSKIFVPCGDSQAQNNLINGSRC